jgi:ubiquinone/menaquinone biosynthesis C-methylase UbiE
MAKFHFVEDYEALVKNLVETMPLDEAMSTAVGGHFQLFGDLEKRVLTYAGLRSGMSIIDYGCGSGRLAHALAGKLNVEYLGIDVVDALLQYAASKSPQDFKFVKHQELNVPVVSDVADMICAFSLFTHLLPAESYIYIQDMHRVLKKGGRLVFSFLEFDVPEHWTTFQITVDAQRTNAAPHLNMFLEKSVINHWANHIGFKIIEFINGDVQHFNGDAFGQSVAILQK